MSVVTNCILTGLGGFDPDYQPSVIDTLQQFLDAKEIPGQLVEVSKFAQGPKAMEAFCWIGAFNWLPIGEFVEVYRDSLRRLARSAWSAQLLLKRQEDACFYHVPNSPQDDGRYCWDSRDDFAEHLQQTFGIRHDVAMQSQYSVIAELRNAIRHHRDQRGDDRCWQDDYELYAVLPEGYSNPPKDSRVMLELCQRYIASRQDPAVHYCSPQRRIEELEQEVASLKKQLQERPAC